MSREALRLLEKASEEITDVVIDMRPGPARDRLVRISEEIDEFMYDRSLLSETDPTIDDYEDDGDEEGADEGQPAYELDIDLDEPEAA